MTGRELNSSRREQSSGREAQAFSLGQVMSGYAPLNLLKNVSVKSTDFLQNLSRLQEIINQTPIALPQAGEYSLELAGNELRIFEAKTGVKGFQVLAPIALGPGVHQSSTVTQLEIGVGDTKFKIVLHHEPLEDEKPARVKRRTSPWRASQLSSENSGAASESRASSTSSGGCGSSGESRTGRGEG
jgi:hypothetical protein